MSRFLVFSNPGKLDLNFIRLMGVSVKESDSAIGFFGTGLKYAIATILRNKGWICIFIDHERFIFETKPISLRGKHFEQITMNGELLPFTTELGRQWEPWMAIRELYSNALDEGGEMNCGSGDVYSKPGTWIFVDGDPFIKVYDNRKKYFISKSDAPLYSNEFVDVYPSATGMLEESVFYKGIKVGQLAGKSAYRYNIKNKIDLTEDRTVKWVFQIQESIERALITSSNPDWIRHCLTREDHYENNLFFNDAYTFIGVSDEFISVVKSLALQRPKGFNVLALKWLDRRFSVTRQHETVEPTKIQAIQIQKSLACLSKMGYASEIELYPIRVTHSLGEGIMGQALDGVIWLSVHAFTQGTKYICSTILEEFVHLRFGFKDYTVELQTWLFDMIVSMAENFVLGEPL